MPNLHSAISQLQLAKKYLERITKVQFQDSVIDDWGAFLTNLDLCLSRADEGFKDVENKYRPMKGDCVNRRKNDELLAFLYQARHSYYHETRELIGPVIVSKTPLLIPPVRIQDKEGNIIQSFYYPSEIRVKEFKNRNGTWMLPKTHRNKELKYIGNPFEIGTYGLLFYADFLKSLYTKIVKKGTYQDLENLVDREKMGLLLNHPNHCAITEFMPVKEETEYEIID